MGRKAKILFSQHLFTSSINLFQPDGIKEYLCKNPNRKNVPESVSEDLDLAICLKDGIKHVADEL